MSELQDRERAGTPCAASSIAAAVKINTKHRITGVYPTTSEEAVRAILLAFLRAMPDWESVTGPATDPIDTPKYYRLALLINDIEKETP